MHTQESCLGDSIPGRGVEDLLKSVIMQAQPYSLLRTTMPPHKWYLVQYRAVYVQALGQKSKLGRLVLSLTLRSQNHLWRRGDDADSDTPEMLVTHRYKARKLDIFEMGVKATLLSAQHNQNVVQLHSLQRRLR